MQLKKLEMCGFKSFANRTEIVFNPGITAIVGPNGCGKSNVVDAIKWVLGTLSYKSVRGEEMLDVIFKGAEGVAAMGFAEVSLTLDNSDHTLAIEFEEVTITRRMFSTGEGEYYINKAPCRLKDIRELLYGTGIGTDNYSVIEQGKIDKLVLSNPHERRLVFDEAAGISKYRARKRETENRLEKVSGDLLRLQDVIHEVQKQLRSVRAQAGRAARYKELTGELKEKRTKFCVHEHRALKLRGTELDALTRTRSEERDRLKGEMERCATEQDEAQRRLESETERHAGMASNLASLESEVEYLSRSIETVAVRIRELQEEKAGQETDRASQEARATEIGGQVERETHRKAELDESVRALAEQAEEARRRLEDALAECSRLESEIEEKKGEAVELAHKESQYKNEGERLRKDREALEARSGEIAAQEERLGTQLEELGAKVGGARTVHRDIEKEIADLMERKRVEDAEQARLREERGELERELARLREEKEHRVARRETLRDLEDQLEGLESGAQTLLRERPEGVLGAVADFLEVAPEHVAIVEGALGERAGAVVCRTATSAEQAARLVRERGLGRTTVIALDECRNEFASGVEPGETGVMGRASARVAAPEPFDGLVQALLGQTWVVENGEVARRIRMEGLLPVRLVTTEGDVFDFPGILTTGGTRAAQGLISRKAELRRLEEETGQYLQVIEQREARRHDVESRLRTADEKIDLFRQQVYEKTVTLSETASQIEQIAVREQFLSNERDALAAEGDAIGRQSEAVAERTAALETLLAKLTWLKSQVETEIAANVRTLGKYEQGKADLQDAMTQARVESAKAVEQRAAVEERLEMLWENREEASRALDRLARQLGETVGRLQSAEQEHGRLESDRAAHGERVAVAQAEAEEAARSREALSRAVETARSERARVESELLPCEEELQRLRVEEEGLRVKTESLLQRTRDEMQIDLRAVDDSAPEEEGIDWEALGHGIDALRGKIAAFGAVNVVALDQLAELEEREKYLLAQGEDLEKSKDQLQDLIRQLNRESRELFEKTIDFVREQFNAVFRKIFGGGKADIILEQEEGVDSMEQGLEIMARPPQKELTAISLLSGGERSLTAIALVMALFRQNPSPFCLLDEADAALDEKNVERYAGLVREFASETQFIVITHNKRTMTMADAMYGITMEQPGVSKKVSVNLSGDDNLELLKAKGAPPAPAPA